MSLINPRNVVLVDGKWVVVREVGRDEIGTLAENSRTAKDTLDLIQDKLGTINTPDPFWVGSTPAEQAELLRKSVVALSEIVEKQLKIIYFLAGDKLDN